MIKVSEACAQTEGNAMASVTAAAPVVKHSPSFKWLGKVNMKALLYNHIQRNRHKHTQGEITKAEAYVKERDFPNNNHHYQLQKSSRVLWSLHNIFAKWASLASTRLRVLHSELKCVQFISLAEKKKEKKKENTITINHCKFYLSEF